MEYVKINSLYKRGLDHNIIEGQYSLDEFTSVNRWQVEEKIDGMNIRIEYKVNDDTTTMSILGRTKDAQMPVVMNEWFANNQMMTIELFKEIFENCPNVILFGEGYGPKINSGGYYRKDTSFILFDVIIGRWWLDREGVKKIAERLNLDMCPDLGIMTVDQIVNFVKSKPLSKIAREPRMMEGIIARSDPFMFQRNGQPVMFKLKCKEF